jgi:hypothetical protein
MTGMNVATVKSNRLEEIFINRLTDSSHSAKFVSQSVTMPKQMHLFS